MKHVYDKTFRYTPSRDMGADYLKKRFDAIRRELKAKARVTVQPLLRRKA